MPMYSYRASCGCRYECFLPLKQFSEVQRCSTHGNVMERVIGAPLLVKAQPDIAYDSPIDGHHVTSWHGRREDLKKNGCIEYDEEMKNDYHRRIAESERQLDEAMGETVEEALEKMPTAKRAKLYSELTEQGMDIEYTRTTKGA
jgi:hypothetical protein